MARRDDRAARRRAVVARRMRTIPTVTGAWLVTTLLFGPLLLAAIVVDSARAVTTGKPFVATRMLAFGWVYLTAETVGIVAAFAIWMLGAGFARPHGRRYLAWNYALQRLWSGTIGRAAVGLLRLRLDVTGADQVTSGPFLLLTRHASIVDNLLPSALVANPNHLRVRYVMKQELLADPCLDIVGSRLPNYFVDRKARDPAGEIARVKALAAGIGRRDAVLIYPEGTRFTPDRQRKAVARLERRDPSRHAWASHLRHVLPPRLGGPLALLEAAPDADVVICAHAGFEGFATFGDLWSGALLGAEVHVRFTRFAAASLPPDREGRAAWIDEQWTAVDAWIDRQSAARMGGP
jgi:1-acyl-sn-glycerol-3-phosphate acyltransferase